MLHVSIVTPDGVIYNDEVEKISVPTTSGEVTVLKNHIPLVSVVAPGELVIYKGDHTVPIVVSGGMLEVDNKSQVKILADTAERAEHVDVERAETARKRAEELMKTQKFDDDVQFAALQAKIEKELARERVGRKYKKIRTSS